RLAELRLDAAVAAVGGEGARNGADAGAVGRRHRLVVRAVVADLRAALDAVAAVAGERAVGVARAVAAVVDAVVALFARVLEPVAALEAAVRVAGVVRRAVVRAVVALLGGIDLAVAAGLEDDERLAVGRARAGLPVVHAVVAHLAELTVDRLVAAVRRGRAAVRAEGLAVRGRAVRSALVARLGRVLEDAVA